MRESGASHMLNSSASGGIFPVSRARRSATSNVLPAPRTSPRYATIHFPVYLRQSSWVSHSSSSHASGSLALLRTGFLLPGIARPPRGKALGVHVTITRSEGPLAEGGTPQHESAGSATG